MPAIKYRRGYASVRAEVGCSDCLPVQAMGEWSIVEFGGFCESTNGLLVAVSDVLFFSLDEYKWENIEGLLLGLMESENMFKLVLNDSKPIVVPGAKYKHPSFTDQNRCSVTNINSTKRIS